MNDVVVYDGCTERAALGGALDASRHRSDDRCIAGLQADVAFRDQLGFAGDVGLDSSHHDVGRDGTANGGLLGAASSDGDRRHHAA